MKKIKTPFGTLYRSHEGIHDSDKKLMFLRGHFDFDKDVLKPQTIRDFCEQNNWCGTTFGKTIEDIKNYLKSEIKIRYEDNKDFYDYNYIKTEYDNINNADYGKLAFHIGDYYVVFDVDCII